MENGYDLSFLEEKEDFAFLPTPVHRLKNLSSKLDCNLYIKRDDQTGLAFGGNKTRKLEYLMKEVSKHGHDCVITVGCPQSNHVRQTAAACRLFQVECYIVLIGDKEEFKDEGNILLDKMLGGKISFCESETAGQQECKQLLDRLTTQEGKKPCYIPAGGSNVVGVCGYINAFKEMLEDEKRLGIQFDYIFFASSSLGTQAGLILGNKLLGDSKKKVYGVSVCKSFLDSQSGVYDTQKMKNLMTEFCNKHSLDVEISDADIIYDERFHETGYAVLSPQDQLALTLFATEEAIILDPVYSARAAGGMLQVIQNGEVPKQANILFLHTGGGPALFSQLYKYQQV